MRQFLPIQAKANKSASSTTKRLRTAQPSLNQSKQREHLPTQLERAPRLGFSLSQIPILPPTKIAQLDNPGHPLSETVRQKMETTFGHDFSDVRIHEGPQAPAIGALAYTQDPEIHFAPGTYQPASTEGQAIIGHELTHVVQQRAGRVEGKGTPINVDPALEHEANRLGTHVAQGNRVEVSEANTDSQTAQISAPIQMMARDEDDDNSDDDYEDEDPLEREMRQLQIKGNRTDTEEQRYRQLMFYLLKRDREGGEQPPASK